MNAPSEVICCPNVLLEPKRKDQNLFEARFVKLSNVDFFLLFNVLLEKMFNLGS